MTGNRDLTAIYKHNTVSQKIPDTSIVLCMLGKFLEKNNNYRAEITVDSEIFG